MAKMWAGRTSGETSALADELNSSIKIDSRMYKQDIAGSKAHAQMLSKQGIISEDDASSIINGLDEILADIESGKLSIDMSAEDIHMFVEEQLTKRIGDAGKKVHTARSRNDQVALDFRLYILDETEEIISLMKELILAVVTVAKNHSDKIMPGYTHLQRAQPILFSHQLLAYAMMLCRDIERLSDCKKRTGVSPIGSCALAGTTFNTDRKYEAKLLGLESICLNSIDGVSDRDFAVEFTSDLAIIQMHLSRFAEELVLWSSSEFGYITFSDDFTTGSSIMPQKKNPDMAELVRGKTGRVYGDLTTLLTLLKGLPLAYNKDMQEDKEAVFDAIDTVKLCLKVTAPMVSSMQVNGDAMKEAAKKGFINATDLADYMVNKGLPFRDAYKISGNIVADCIKKDLVLETYSIEEYKKQCALIENDVYDVIDLKNCVDRRISEGGTSLESVLKQIELLEQNEF